MLPGIHRATQKFYIFLLVYLTGRTPTPTGATVVAFDCLLPIEPSIKISTKVVEHFIPLVVYGDDEQNK